MNNRLMEDLAGHAEQKILVQLDTEPQHFNFQPENHILNKFDVFTEIPFTPINLLLAQKFYALIKGKDRRVEIFLTWSFYYIIKGSQTRL